MKKPDLGPSFPHQRGKSRMLMFEEFSNRQQYMRAEVASIDVPKFTGRYVAALKKGVQDFEPVQKVFESGKVGLKTASRNDYKQAPRTDELEGIDVLLYPRLRVALVSGEQNQINNLATAAEAEGSSFTLTPERVMSIPRDEPSLAAAAAGTPATWGLVTTNVINSNYTGKGVKVAILDTGLDLSHPDFKGRNIFTKCFDDDGVFEDGHGHGTHCTGTACGNTDINGLRYGVAGGSTIYSGKVLNDGGHGAPQWIAEGITWAVDQGCKIISLSLTSRVSQGEPPDPFYENSLQYAKDRGVIVVAAAGNDSDRANSIYVPVSSPANSPLAIAIAAIDNNLNVGNFSNRSINPNQNINIAAPGVNIYSSWPMPTRYYTISGTSMAAPHVAGILALLYEQYPAYTPAQIVQELAILAQPLTQDVVDVGNGLVMAVPKSAI